MRIIENIFQFLAEFTEILKLEIRLNSINWFEVIQVYKFSLFLLFYSLFSIINISIGNLIFKNFQIKICQYLFAFSEKSELYINHIYMYKKTNKN
jgi:hypothetical protein